MGFLEKEELNPPLTGQYLEDIKENARILLVLDYPSNDNVKERKINYGSVATILSMCMSSAGIIFSSCSICYAIPLANENKTIYKYFTEKGGFTTEALPFLELLKENIKKANPTVIVPVGELSLQALTGKKGIEKWRGSVLESLYGDTKCIPIIHPRDSFKRYLLKYHIAADFKRIEKESYFKEIIRPKRELKINPSFCEVISYLDNILEKKLTVASDIECPIPKCIKDKESGITKIYGTRGVTCISFAISPFACMSIPFNNFVWTEDEEVEIWLRIAKIYEDREIKTKWQNGAAFDLIYLFMVHKCLVLGPISDTLIKTNVLYPEFPKSLAFLTSTRTDECYYKDDGKEINVDGTRDWNQYYIYNAKDSAVDYEIDTSLDEELLESKNKAQWDYSERLIEPLFYMQCRGIKVNIEKLLEHKKEAKAYLKTLQDKLNLLTGTTLNVSSPKQVIEYFYKTKGFSELTKTVKDPDTGVRSEKVTVDNKAMTKLARKYDCEEARLVKQIRGTRKLIGTYLEPPFDEDGRLRCSFKQSTKFGRLASSKTPFKTGYNMQNLPKVFLEFLEPDEDHMCFELDKKQAEWVASAYYFNDVNMIKAVEEGADIHVRTAQLMFKAPKELIELEDSILGPLTEPTEIEALRREKCPEVFNYPILPNMSMRQSGKKCNHSFNYGLSANGYSNNYDMPTSVGKVCYALYHSAYPGIKHGHEKIRNKIVMDRTLVNAFGWVRRFLGRLDDDTFRQAYSFYGQSTVGRLLNEGLITTYNDQYTPELSSFMRDVDIFNQVHDSIKGQYPDNEESLRNFAKALKQMQRNLDIPLKANGKTYTIRTDGKVGYNLKKMKPIPLYGTEEEIYQALIEIKKELKPLKKSLPSLPEVVEEALFQEEEDEIQKRIQGKEYEF